MINLTEKAAVKIKQISDDDSLGHYVVRIKTIGGGCAGMTNDMFYDDQISETDEISELDGVKIICDFLSFQYLDGTTIDYLDHDMGGGFKFLNPNVKSSCGCGKSVSY